MAAPMVDVNAEAFEKMLNEGQAGVTEALLKLRKSLAQYGFRGTLTCTIDVAIVDDSDGIEQATAKRVIQHKFKR